MNIKIIMIIVSIGILMAYPQTAKSQVKPVSELKIVKEALSEEESAQYRSGGKSPSGAYRLEREEYGKNHGHSIIDNKSGVKHLPTILGNFQISSWSKAEDRIAFNVSMIPTDGRKYTGAVGVYFFDDKSTKIFKPDEYLLMNSQISPDGKKIVCTGSTKKEGYIIVIDVASGELKIVNDKVSSQPIWVPFSDKVIYVEFVRRGLQRIVAVDTKTGKKFDVIESAYNTRHEISPDGKKIAFTSPDTLSSGLRALYIIDIDGRNQKKIATIDIRGHFYPKWSPEGIFISYQRPIIKIVKGHHERTVATELYLYDIINKDTIQLTDEPGVLHKVIRWGKDDSLVISSEIDGSDKDRIYSTYSLYRL